MSAAAGKADASAGAKAQTTGQGSVKVDVNTDVKVDKDKAYASASSSASATSGGKPREKGMRQCHARKGLPCRQLHTYVCYSWASGGLCPVPQRSVDTMLIYTLPPVYSVPHHYRVRRDGLQQVQGHLELLGPVQEVRQGGGAK